MPAALAEKPRRPRGRPKLYDWRVSVHLTQADYEYIEALADRLQLSYSAAARRLIRETIRARKAKARK